LSSHSFPLCQASRHYYRFPKANFILTSFPSERNSSSLFTTAISFEIAIGFGGLILGMLIGPEARLYVPQWFETKLLGQGLLWGTVAAIPMTLFVIALSALPLESIRVTSSRWL
jgi:uncharacterized membrane protein (DUF485 family)